MSIIIFPLPLIILQLLTLFICIALEAIVLQQKLRLTRKQSIEFSISINLLSTIALWFVFFAFQTLAPESQKLHLISIILFNNLYNLDRWSTIYPVLTLIAIMMFALVIFVEFKALQMFQTLLQIFSEQNASNQNESMPLINRINMAILQSDSEALATVFQANILSYLVIIILIVLVNVYGA
ncbi:MAG: hypothetical protein J7647_23205 [Cyanobacteria bacterium SBLK]|nr:hypothetical protein [Cyanobacteria bacterium SBLK]